MTVPTTAPGIVKAFAGQIASATAWTGAGGTAASVFYPRITEASATDPCAVIWLESTAVDFPFLDVPLESGVIVAEISSAALGIDDLEALAQSLSTQIMTSVGIPFLRCTGITPATEDDESEQTGSGGLRRLEITYAYGLEAST